MGTVFGVAEVSRHVCTRYDVFHAINTERDYQSKWDATESEGNHSPLEFLCYISDYTDEALHRGSRVADAECKSEQLDSLRKIAALAVAAMEQHGAPQRKSQ